MTQDEALKLALEAAYLEGFNASGEGYNGEYPFQDNDVSPEKDNGWIRGRDNRISAIKEALAQPERDYERGFVDGMLKPAQSSVDKAVNAMSQRTWVGLTDEDIWEAYMESPVELDCSTDELYALSRTVEAKLKQKNGYAEKKNT